MERKQNSAAADGAAELNNLGPGAYNDAALFPDTSCDVRVQLFGIGRVLCAPVYRSDERHAVFFDFRYGHREGRFKGTGSSFLPGHITASEPGRTAFTLSRGNNPPDFDLVWDEASATLTWVGIPNNPERRTVESTCTSIPPPAK